MTNTDNLRHIYPLLICRAPCMSHPVATPSLPLNAARSDPPVRRVRLESLPLFPLLSLAHLSTADSWPRKVCWPRSPCANDDGPLVASSGAGRQSRGTTSQRSALIPKLGQGVIGDGSFLPQRFPLLRSLNAYYVQRMEDFIKPRSHRELNGEAENGRKGERQHVRHQRWLMCVTCR